MLAIGTASAAEATPGAMPSTATAALPAPGQVSAAGAAAIGSTCSPSTVGGTAWSGHSRVVAEYAPISSAMIAIGTSTRGAEGRAPRRVAQQLGADRHVGRRRGIEIAGRGRGVRDRVFVDPGDRDAAGRRRRGRAPTRGRRGGWWSNRRRRTVRRHPPPRPSRRRPPAPESPSPKGCRRRPAPAPPRRRTWPSAAQWNRRCRVRTLRRPRWTTRLSPASAEWARVRRRRPESSA